MAKQVLGISGGAGVGKDTLCQNLISRFAHIGKRAKRFALADELKLRVRDFAIKEFNIDILHCDRVEKDFLRPLLVCFGKLKRNQSEGTFWTGLMKEKIDADDCEIAIITDLRYCEYEHDEIFWVKESMNGKIIHISRYDLQENGDKIYLPYPNEEEAKNDPLIKKLADFPFEWPSFPDVCSDELNKVVDDFFIKLNV